MIGVQRKNGSFSAHAWLDGLDDGGVLGFQEITRLRPARQGRIDDSRATRVFAMAHVLRIEGVIAEVTQAFEAAEVGVIALKGPSFAQWLYDPGELRAYGDADLLVDSSRLQTAREVVSGLGFKATSFVPVEDSISHLHDEWHRDGIRIDLAVTLDEVDTAPERCWKVLQTHLDTMTVGKRRVTVLDEPGRTVNLVLHAAHHRYEFPRVLEDLSRALIRLDPKMWIAAWELAGELDAQDAFLSGLRLDERGRALAAKLGDGRKSSMRDAWTQAGQPDLVLGFHQLADARGLRNKVLLLARELVPSPTFMRWAMPMARRGPAGLVLAYLLRPFELVRKAPPALFAYVRLRRSLRG